MRSAGFQEKLEKTLLVCRNEWGSLVWLMVLNFILGTGFVIAFSVVNAIFIWRIGFQGLPITFIIAALVMLPYFTIYTQMENRFNRMWILIISFIVYGALLAISATELIKQPDNTILIYVVYVLSTCILLLTNVQFWSFANFVYHPRQGKRLFPLIGFGGTLGVIIFGFNMQNLVSRFGSEKLIYLWAGTFLISAFFVFLIFRYVNFPAKSKPACAVSLKDVLLSSFKVINKVPVMSVISAIVFLISFVSFILYFQFNRAVGETLVTELSNRIQTQPSLFEYKFAGYVGTFHAVLYLAIILVYQIFFTSRIISGMGIVNSLYIQPALLAIPVIFTIIRPDYEKMLQVGYFINVLCLATFFRTASESIYGSVPEQQREEAMCFIKIIVTPFSLGLSGLLLVWLVKMFPDRIMLALNILIPITLILWVFSIKKLKKLFIETLFNNFAAGRKSQELGSLLSFSKMKSSASLEILRRVMAKGSKKMKIFALELAGEMKLSILTDEILEFVKSDDEVIRIAAFNALGTIGDKKLYSTLMKTYKDQDSKLRIILMENLEKINSDSFNINAPFLLNEEEDDRVAGFLLEVIWKKKPLNVEQEHRLTKLFDSKDEEALLYGVRCLSMDKEGKYRNKLLELMEKGSPNIQQAAVKSVSDLKIEEAIPMLINLLGSGSEKVADEASNALVNLGEKAASATWETINDNDSVNLTRRKLMVVASNFNKKNLMLLIENAGKFSPEALVPPLSLISRNLPSYTKFEGNEKQLIENLVESVEKEIRDNYSAAFSLLQDKKSKVFGLLGAFLEERNNLLKRIILICLHLLNPKRRILTIMDNIFSGDERKKNIALEAFENIFPEYRTRFIPLFEKETLEEEINYISDLFSLTTKGPEMVLKILDRNPNELMHAWVLYAAGELGIDSWREDMEKETKSPDPVISEHAKLGLAILNGG